MCQARHLVTRYLGDYESQAIRPTGDRCPTPGRADLLNQCPY